MHIKILISLSSIFVFSTFSNASNEQKFTDDLGDKGSYLKISSTKEKSPYAAFSLAKDTDASTATLRLTEIDTTCCKLEEATEPGSIPLFLGRSVAWFYDFQRYKLDQNYTRSDKTWTHLNFSGGSSLDGIDSKLYTTEQLLGYRDYMQANGLTPKVISEAPVVYLIDFIMEGRTMTHFSQILQNWCMETGFQAPQIQFIDISFTTNYRSIFEHEEILKPAPQQFILSETTMNPLIHARGEDSIGKDHSFSCSFTPEYWVNWEDHLDNYKPSQKYFSMKAAMEQFLDKRYQ